jgi:hypothetical protein
MIERAYEIARSGSVANLDQLVRALKREGFELVEAHLRSSPSLNRELRLMCRSAWASAGREPIPERRPI